MKKVTKILLCFLLVFTLTACQGGTSGKEENNELPAYTVDPQAVTLTVAGTGAETIVYTAEDLAKLGTVTYSYSGRNKQVENARQFFEFTGVELSKVLKASGFDIEDVNIKVVCGDNYTREYSVEDLYELYTYEDNETDNKEEVLPMIAILEPSDEAEYPSPFKLIYGQEDWDTLSAQDFNMQGWATYIQYIEITCD